MSDVKPTLMQRWWGRLWGNKPEPKPFTRGESTQQARYNPSVIINYAAGEMPILGGRVSDPDFAGSTLTGLNGLNEIQPDYPPEFLQVLQHLASTNGDISYAVSNVVEMGGTDYSIEFGDNIGEEQAKKMRMVLQDSIRGWYQNGGSEATLINDLLDQCVVNGALSAEAVIRQDLRGISHIALVNPKNIVFRYDMELDDYIPYQRVTNTVKKRVELTDGYIKLNRRTYKYHAVRRRGDKPYGIPPFLSALEMTDVEWDVLRNFKKVAKNIGVLGFMQLMVNRPVRLQRTDNSFAESEAEYNARCLAYLNNVIRPEAEKGFTTGVMTGFKQDLTVEYAPNNSTNLNGAKDFVEVITVNKHAGLKQDPILLGRPFNTSEALGRVILDKFTAQVSNYQGIVADFLEEMFSLELILQGFPVTKVYVTFTKPSVKDKKNEEEARKIQIENVITLRDEGVISQMQLANELGYDVPFAEGRITGDTTTNETTQTQEIALELGADLPMFPYGDKEGQCCTVHTYENGGDDDLETFIADYSQAAAETYQKALAAISVLVGKKLASLPKNSSQTKVFDAIYSTILRAWNRTFATPMGKVVDEWVEEIYRFYRASKNPFGKKGKDIPEATFDRIDVRAMRYMKDSDKFYFGKFITDDDTKKRLKDWVYREFAKGDIPLGQTAGQRAFLRSLANELGLEEWKLVRIAATTANKAKNYGAINYMHQAGVQKYEVVALLDNKTSDVCRSMNGKTFFVSTGRAKVVNVSKTLPENVPKVTPFVTAVFKDLSELDNLSGEELAADYAIFSPPFHPHCRTQLVAVL